VESGGLALDARGHGSARGHDGSAHEQIDVGIPRLSAAGIPLLATGEPIDIAGMNATTILVRRIKQGVAEWCRFQVKEEAWNGFREHTMDGYNIGTPPNGYAAGRVPHPAPAKAAQGRTKTRLVPDPERAPVVARIYQWRITGPKTRVCSFGLRARHSVAGHCLILRSNPRSS